MQRRSMDGRMKRRDDGTWVIGEETDISAWVLEVQDDQGGRLVPLVRDRYVLGTADSADIVMRDRTVSAEHCALVPKPGGVGISDLGSTNGTFVGGARIKEARAGAGTVISVGRSTLVLGPANDTTAADADDDAPPLPGIAGVSVTMRRLAAVVRRLARSGHPVLVAGETGTGKELIARALHTEGPRKDQPFVVINVAALPRELVESELFGHERGAFTGAVTRRAGAFAEAEGGTLFLDEIGELPLEAQPKLLRALDGYEVRRVGASGSGTTANVRVVTASHVPLEERVREGRFRRDLFHRLAVLVAEVPPLRDRRGDVPAIAARILSQARAEIGYRELSPSALARLASHDWPGNVRELRNILVRAADFARDQRTIDGADVERALRPRAGSVPPPPLMLTPAMAKTFLAQNRNNMSAAARAAGYPRTTFRKILLGLKSA